MTQNIHRVRVTGALALVLYVARILGAAPLVFEAHGIRISRFLSFLGRVNIILTGVFLVIDGYFEIFYLNTQLTIFSRSFFGLILLGILITNIIAVFNAPSRMKLYLRISKVFNQINRDIKDINVEKIERRIDHIIKYYLVINLFINFTSHVYFLTEDLNGQYGIYAVRQIMQKAINCFQRMLLAVLTLQLTIFALRVFYCLQHVNAHFSLLIEEHKNHGSVNEARSRRPSSVRKFALPYMSVCDIVSQVLENDENIIIITLFTFFLSLGWIVQTFFSEIYKFNLKVVMNSIYMMVTCGTLLSYLVMLIEPCHRVHEEMEITNQLVRNFLESPNLSLQVINELKAFKLLLRLNKPTYSPLRVYTLARPLFLKIVGALVSYSVFVLQLSEDFF